MSICRSSSCPRRSVKTRITETFLPKHTGYGKQGASEQMRGGGGGRDARRYWVKQNPKCKEMAGTELHGGPKILQNDPAYLSYLSVCDAHGTLIRQGSQELRSGREVSPTATEVWPAHAETTVAAAAAAARRNVTHENKVRTPRHVMPATGQEVDRGGVWVTYIIHVCE